MSEFSKVTIITALFVASCIGCLLTGQAVGYEKGRREACDKEVIKEIYDCYPAANNHICILRGNPPLKKGMF